VSAARFPAALLREIHIANRVKIKAGRGRHRLIGIWAVLVERRVFVRSWSLKPRSWYRTFLVEPIGTIEVRGRKIRIRAVRTRSLRLKAAVDRAYLAKYNTPSAIRYAKDLCRAKSRATTTELVPA